MDKKTPEMKILGLQLANSRLRKSIRKLKQAQNLAQNKKKASQFSNHDPTEKPTADDFRNHKIDIIFQDFIDNRTRSKSKRRYSTYSKLYALGLFERSPEAYQWARNVLPLPSETTLRKNFSKKIQDRQNDLTSIEGISKIVNIMQTNIVNDELIKDLDNLKSKVNELDCFQNNSYISEFCDNSPANFDTLPENHSIYTKDSENLNQNLNDSTNNQKFFLNNKKRKKIDCVLCVDAFSCTFLMKKERIEKQINEFKNVFLYIVCPINFEIKPFIVHMHSMENGNANKTVEDRINIIREKFKLSIFNIKYISCDGDHFYDTFFNLQIEKLINAFLKSKKDLFMEIEELLLIWISDPLHLWKNGRSRLLSSKIVINPFGDCSIITCEKINDLLGLGPVLCDKSSIGKMRDVYPISLFNFKNSLYLLQNKIFESFSYIFIYSLWNEAILNSNISPDTREYLLLILLHILVHLYNSHKEKLPENVKFKKSKDCLNVTIFTQDKLKRLISTVAIQIFEIENGDLKTGLERLGNYCIEAQIGIIRILCKNDHRLARIFRSAASLTILKEISKDLFPSVHKRTRLCSGGCKLCQGTIPLNFGASYDIIGNIVLGIMGFGESPDEKDIELFTSFLEKFIASAPYKLPSLPSSNTHRTIINRYASQSPLQSQKDFQPQFKQRYTWTKEDDEQIDSLILEKNEKEIFNIFKDRKKKSIQSRIRERRTAIAERPIEISEIPFIDKIITENYPFKEILPYLKHRTLKSLTHLVFKRKEEFTRFKNK